MDVVAIDFETATGNAHSACQLAAVVVQGSEIVAEHSWLIRPPGMRFSSRNIAIHGIRPQDVAEAGTLAQLWPEIEPVLAGQVLLAHNARFDIGVLVASLAAHDIACPALEFTCTRLLARCTWPGRPGYGLKPLGDWLGVEFRHHDALEDTRCCVQIALAVQQRQELQELAALEQQLRITRGAYRQGQIVSPRRIGGRDGGAGSRGPSQADRWGFPDRRARNLGAADPEAIVRAAAGRQPLAGKRIVLLGPLRGLSLEHSRELIDRLGGHSQENVAADTDYVVACGTTLDAAGQIVCAALAAADSNPESPASHAEGIRLLSERQFRALLPAGKTSLGW